MKIYNSLEEIIDHFDETVIALGNFDGVHKGHQELIRRCVNTAKSAGYKSAVFTFSNHPRNLIAGERAVKNIMYPEDKAHIIGSFGIDYMFNIPFTEKILTTDPIDFIDDILLSHLRMKEAYCGFNYRFGYKALGTPTVLMEEGMKKNFSIHIMKPYSIDGLVASSSLIREQIEMGNVSECMKFMGRHYAIKGEVVVGNRIGRTIGFPTSNILIDEAMVTPPNGVYVTNCLYNGAIYPSITNVGVKPTIGKYNKNVETHIFNFDKELYGAQIKVEFLDKMREEFKFDSVEELSEQIAKDCEDAKNYHIRLGKVL